MVNPFVAEIRIFAGNFAPRGWALCNGQLMPNSQNTALFSLLGTTYGGDGKSNFGLPNLQGGAPIQAGQGAGLSLRALGEKGGEPTVTLLQSQMPSHNHQWMFASAGRFGGNSNSPTNNSLSDGVATDFAYCASSASNVNMSATGLSITGGNQPHNNMPPFLGVTFIMALQGVFPPRG
jgi:microcystin-dependent protein